MMHNRHALKDLDGGEAPPAVPAGAAGHCARLEALPSTQITSHVLVTAARPSKPPSLPTRSPPTRRELPR